MTRVTNTDTQSRRWDTLADEEQGTTLFLHPGESAEVVLPDGFNDPYLKADKDLGEYVAPEVPEEQPLSPFATEPTDESDTTV